MSAAGTGHGGTVEAEVKDEKEQWLREAIGKAEARLDKVEKDVAEWKKEYKETKTKEDKDFAKEQLRAATKHRDKAAAELRQAKDDLRNYDNDKRQEAAAAKGLRSFGDGLPPLGQRVASSSKPSENKGHVEASVQVGSFGVVGDLDLAVQSAIFLTYQRTKLKWSSESDIQGFVKTVLTDAIAAAGLEGKVDCFNEVSVIGLRPDIWVVMSESGVPVGVVEVKRPSDSIMSSPYLHGQLFDYMQRLQSFFGMQHVFGIASTYSQWRIYWLPGSDAAAKATMVSDMSDSSLVVEEAPESDSEEDCKLQCEDAFSTRTLCGTDVIQRKDEHLPAILASVIKKMVASPRSPVKIIDLNRPYIRITEKQWYWSSVRFPDNFKLRHGAVPTAGDLILLQDLRHGADGRVWRACSDAGWGCVVKFALSPEPTKRLLSLDEAKKALEHEAKVWEEVWCEDDDKFKAVIRTFCGVPALVMPYMRHVPETLCTDEQKQEVINAVKRMAERGCQHGDLKWSHVGFESPSKGKRAFMFDLANVIVLDDSKEAKEEAVRAMLRDLALDDGSTVAADVSEADS